MSPDISCKSKLSVRRIEKIAKKIATLAYDQKFAGTKQWVVSSTFQIVQILVRFHLYQLSMLLSLQATEPLTEQLTQMTVELISFSTAKEISEKTTLCSCKKHNKQFSK